MRHLFDGCAAFAAVCVTLCIASLYACSTVTDGQHLSFPLISYHGANGLSHCCSRCVQLVHPAGRGHHSSTGRAGLCYDKLAGCYAANIWQADNYHDCCLRAKPGRQSGEGLLPLLLRYLVSWGASECQSPQLDLNL